MPSAHLVHSTSARLLSEVHPRRHNFHLREPYSNHVKHARQRNVLATRMRMSAARVEWQVTDHVKQDSFCACLAFSTYA